MSFSDLEFYVVSSHGKQTFFHLVVDVLMNHDREGLSLFQMGRHLFSSNPNLHENDIVI